MTDWVMSPAPGERVLRFVGDQVSFSLRPAGSAPWPSGWQARLRTNLGRAAMLREEIILSQCRQVPPAGASWTDIPMAADGMGYELTLPLAEVGYFRAKAYAIDPQGRQHWPWGADFGISVHPDAYRTANTIYCAFTRMFGPGKSAVATHDEKLEHQLKSLDERGYTVIPPSGKLRDLQREFPHIFETLRCRILHLLPVNPTPTTFARFGRFGSPYAAQDLTAIDPALVEFDRHTTGVDQFRELTYDAHLRGGRVFIDLVINHTGWGATLQENHPEWYLRSEGGAFASPGAWGTTWEDLVELEHRHVGLWDHLAEVFLTWCRRGVDGFRCDAGYKVPLVAWQYIIARVRQEFPEAVFLLEGLGGAWQTTEDLLTAGGMQWAYSELFQNYSGQQVGGYLDYSSRQSERVGLYIHYSETHDNLRLAAKGRAWSLLRNRLCALTSPCGGFAFTSGVEWLATERIQVHSCRGMAWGNDDNIIPELARLNQLIADHPCFFDGAKLTRLSSPESSVFALRRDSAEGNDSVLILVNTDDQSPQKMKLDESALGGLGDLRCDLLEQPLPRVTQADAATRVIELPPAAAFCLSANGKPKGLSGDDYRRARAQAAWAVTAMAKSFAVEKIPLAKANWRELAEHVANDPAAFLAELADLLPAEKQPRPAIASARTFPKVVTWTLSDLNRVLLVPAEHWLLIRDVVRFHATLRCGNDALPLHLESIPVRDGHVACVAPRRDSCDAELQLERYAGEQSEVEAVVRFLNVDAPPAAPVSGVEPHSLVLLTNGRGGMARLGVDFGAIRSKYDCLLGANLHAEIPVDRHVFAKRARAWVNADGFITALSKDNLIHFEPGPPARWKFAANAGDGRIVELELIADMLDQQNTTVLRFHRPPGPPTHGRELPGECDVRLTVRIDIEDRNFHWETKRNGGSEQHFSSNCHALPDRTGFAFTPASDRGLRVFADSGHYLHEAEWAENLAHPVEQSRAQTGSGDAYSPGWFDLPLAKGASTTVVITAESGPLSVDEKFTTAREHANKLALRRAKLKSGDAFGERLVLAAQQFVVRRGTGKTVIAGYPWFLDWGRDTLIAARGLIAASMIEEVERLLITFGRFVEHGTLPNTIHGDNASNRDTSDAPLWYGIVCEELAARVGKKIYSLHVDNHGKTIADVLREIATGYERGTTNGIRMDGSSALVWSPKHFTWMDTNYPAATPREGYPVEIQVLWIRLLRQLAENKIRSEHEPWPDMAARAQASFEKLFWLEDRGYLADALLAEAGQSAAQARVDSALRSNGLFAVSLGLLTGKNAQRCVDAARRYLVVPGALRTLAPLPVDPPLPVHTNDGRLLNDPANPYWGHYEGDEDTRRKPAYHNGTAWTWTLPTFCEALARAWDFSPAAVNAARNYLFSMEGLLSTGCVGQIPEIIDGDAPHTQRGCDAQAWGVTEALRVWRLLSS
ncbi:MAG: glycogen debranching enzyme N-terminal domain-containing protein [Verrucomicrobia bacterium]|nr:glycogen debranching enzyme N-terminal domain-containing protein [Verrucomicrobiota bacterium]